MVDIPKRRHAKNISQVQNDQTNNTTNMIKELQKRDLMSFVLRFVMVITFHTMLEMMISVYMIIIVVCFTDFFLYDPTQILRFIIDIVVISIAVIVPVSLIYLALNLKHYVKYVYEVAKKYGNAPVDQYEKLKAKYEKKESNNHWAGVVIYLSLTVLISQITAHMYPNMIKNTLLLEIIVPILGVLFGAIWNILGTIRNKRLVWHELIPTWNVPSIKEQVINSNIEYFIQEFVVQVISLGVIFAVFIFVLFNLHEALLSDDTIKEVVTNYRFLVVSFLALVGIYIRIGYKIHYSPDIKEQRVYPSFNYLLKQIKEK